MTGGRSSPVWRNRQLEEYIPNSRSSIFAFYLFRIPLIFSVLLLFFARAEFLEGNDKWYLFLLISAALFYLSDIIVLPVAKVDGGIKFHHLWRTSIVKNDDIRFIHSEPYSMWEFLSKNGETGITLIGKHYWNIYFLDVIRKTNLKITIVNWDKLRSIKKDH